MSWARVREALTGAFNTHLLERTPDSGAWPSDYGGALAIHVRLPTAKLYDEPQPPSKQIKQPSPGVSIAEAELQTHELQELAEQICELRSAAAGYSLKIQIRIEVGGDRPPPDEVIAKVNAVLAEVSSRLKID